MRSISPPDAREANPLTTAPLHDSPRAFRTPQVLFLQGGASSQFAAIPMNLAPEGGVADFIVTGAWGKKAQAEAEKYMTVNLAATSKDSNFSTIPDVKDWKLTPDAKFVHICSNETIGGVEFKDVPDVGDVPLVADMSSNYLSKPIDVEKYGLIYGGVQKNIGPAGMAIVIVREDLIGETHPLCPTMFDYKLMADNDSMYNTPPCWTLYTSGLVFKKLLKMGGLEAVEKMNIEKAAMLYDAIDGSDGYYVSPVDEKYRSLMNVPFTLGGGANWRRSSSRRRTPRASSPSRVTAPWAARARPSTTPCPWRASRRSSTSWLSSRRTTRRRVGSRRGGRRGFRRPPLRLCCPCIYSIRYDTPT